VVKFDCFVISQKITVPVMTLHYNLSNDKFTHLLSPRVAHYDDLSPKCASTYYQYGRALLKKAQKAANHFSIVPKSPPYEKTVEGTSSGPDTASSENSDSEEGIASSIYVHTVTSIKIRYYLSYLYR
jgi:hypothetical protein